VNRFQEKSIDYGDVFKELGIAGQYSDMHRKMFKLRKFMWEGYELKGEQADEILEDLLGNILISIYLVRNNGGETNQRPASPKLSSRQDTGAQRATTAEAAHRAWEQVGDAIRQLASS
jgi:hypothetical protein